MSYFTDVYLKRVNRYGNDYQSRVQGKREENFEYYLLKSVYRVDIEVFLKTMYYNFKDITSRYLIENCNLSLLSEGNFDLKFITDIK